MRKDLYKGIMQHSEKLCKEKISQFVLPLGLVSKNLIGTLMMAANILLWRTREALRQMR